MGQRRIPEATVARLPEYLTALVELAASEVGTVASEGLAQAMGVTSSQVRKDLSFLGTYGTRGVGYAVEELLHHISGLLGLNREWSAVLVGVGNLGRALASYGGLAQRGFRLAALVDADPAKTGTHVAGLEVEALEELPRIVAREGATIAIVTVPGEAAQDVADRLVDAGITSVLNFAPVHVSVPDHVRVRKVDLATELLILAYYENARSRGERRDAPAGVADHPRRVAGSDAS